MAVIAGDDLRHDEDCFADDVVVDFPSTAAAVARVRGAFVAGERSTPLPLSIRVSRQDALIGVTLPLDVPVRCTCRTCGGRGETWAEPCGRCGGRGSEEFRHQLQVTLPAGVCDGARFRFTVTPRHNLSTRIELLVIVH